MPHPIGVRGAARSFRRHLNAPRPATRYGARKASTVCGCRSWAAARAGDRLCAAENRGHRRLTLASDSRSSGLRVAPAGLGDPAHLMGESQGNVSPTCAVWHRLGACNSRERIRTPAWANPNSSTRERQAGVSACKISSARLDPKERFEKLLMSTLTLTLSAVVLCCLQSTQAGKVNDDIQ